MPLDGPPDDKSDCENNAERLMRVGVSPADSDRQSGFQFVHVISFLGESARRDGVDVGAGGH